MHRRIFLASMAVMLLLTLVTGCAGATTGPAAKPRQEILRKSIIGTDWQMYQIRLTLPSGTGFPVLLKLADGDRTDGYFYLEKGSNVDFSVNADSQIYRSTRQASGKINSDRFSFTATKVLGSTYILQLNNTTTNASDPVVVFMEVIYPVKGSIYVPLETTPQTP